MAEAARYMLDTNMVSFLMRSTGPALRRKMMAVPPADLCISSITEAELLYGIAKRPERKDLASLVRSFLDRGTALPWDSAAAAQYGTLRADLESRGTPLGNLDTLIAAHALAAGCILVTNDKSFKQVPRLKVKDWSSA